MFIKNQGSLRENLKVLCKSGFVNRKALQEACKLVDLYLTEEQIEFIMTKLFEEENDLQRLPIDRLFTVFNQKPKEVPIVQKPSDSHFKHEPAKSVHKEEPISAFSRPLVQETTPKKVSEFEQKSATSVTRQSVLKEAPSQKEPEEFTWNKSNNHDNNVVKNASILKPAPPEHHEIESFRVTKQTVKTPEPEIEQPQEEEEEEPQRVEKEEERYENNEDEYQDNKIHLYEDNQKVESQPEVDEKYDEEEGEQQEEEEHEEENEEKYQEEEEEEEEAYDEKEQEEEEEGEQEEKGKKNI